MADANAPKKWGPWGLLRDAIVSTAIAFGLDAWVKDWVKDLFAKHVGPIAGEAVKQRFTDKRAEMLRELRKMSDAGMNLDNLWRRHAESITALHEDHFVELLCKIPPPNPEDPSTARPSVSPDAPGKPTNDRQADILWLNDMTDERFSQAIYFLDHDVVTQWYQRSCHQISRICEKVWGDAKKATVAARSRFGVAGATTLTTLEALWDGVVRLVRWASGNLFRIAIIVMVAMVIFWPLALVVMLIFKTFHSFSGESSPNTTPQQRGIGFLGFIGALIGIPLLIGMYFKLVPTFLDAALVPVVWMGIVAIFCLWRFRWLRVGLISLMIVLTVIFFLGGRTAAKNEIKSMWASGKQVDDLQSRLAAKDAELATIRQQLNERGKTKDPSPKLTGEDTGPQTGEQPLRSARPDASTSEEEDATKTLTATSSRVAPAAITWTTGDNKIAIKHCVHKLKSVACEVTITYDGTDPEEFAFKEGGIATDKDGHAVPIFLGNITSDVGEKAILHHGDLRTFTFSFKDPESGNSTQAKITFHVRQCSQDHSNCDYGDTDAPAFVGIS